MVPVYKTFTLRYNKVIYIPHSYIYHTKMTVRKDTKYMSQSSFGNKFKVTTWGESHGKALGAVVDGCPAGLSLCEDDIQIFLDRRKPGQSRYTTARKEGDLVEILSGVFEGKTTGTPISLMVRNTDQRSREGNYRKSCSRCHCLQNIRRAWHFHLHLYQIYRTC